jgi:GMP synthase (glutamine-hydrolysing)
MKIAIEQLNVLLIQIRDIPDVATHEQRGFEEIAGLANGQFRSINVTTAPPIQTTDLEDVDVVFIGGSGEYSVTSDDHFTQSLIGTVQDIADRNLPLFGSCWGHQFIARALGGTVVTDEARGEVGNQDVFSTPAAAADPVFQHCPEKYRVLMGHHDRVDVLPPGGIELAYSEVCRNQAFHIEGTMIYGTQFHTELTPETLMERLGLYRQYVPDEAEFEAMKRSMQPTPEAQSILPHFLRKVIQSPSSI